MRVEKKDIYDAWVEVTEKEEARRDGVEIEWKYNEEQDAVTELTVPTSSDDLKSPNKSAVQSNSNKGASEVSVSTALSSALPKAPNPPEQQETSNPLEEQHQDSSLLNDESANGASQTGGTNNQSTGNESFKPASSSDDEDDDSVDSNPVIQRSSTDF